MAKKGFTKGLDLLLGGAPEQVTRAIQQEDIAPAQETSTLEDDNVTVEELAKGYAKKETRGRKRNPRPQDINLVEVRKTFILRQDLVKKLGWIAYWERRQVKDIANEMVQGYIDQYEAEHGQVQPAPAQE
jgi:hypothetical protein